MAKYPYNISQKWLLNDILTQVTGEITAIRQ